MTNSTTDHLAEVLEKLKVIREVVREAHWALDDSEDRSHEDPPIYAIPRDNVARLEEALINCENYEPPQEAWDGPGPLVTQIMEFIQSQHAEIERLREALEDVCDYGDLAAVRVARAALNPQPGKESGK